MFDSKQFLSTLTSKPGVYCMKDAKGHVLYVGKAKDLKKRVSSYFRIQNDTRLQALVTQIAHIEVTITSSEKEALLLENTLIKALNPKYNILFKDDKSYPYLFLSDHAFPRLISQRGPQKAKSLGTYFGPYPSTPAVRYTLGLLQKLFKIRQCDDIFFQNRSRPCLQYQIKRCSAPCTAYISEEDYAKEIESVKLFLNGKQRDILHSKAELMTQASEARDFEKAAQLRDQIAQLNQILEQQAVFGKPVHNNIDFVVVQSHLESTYLVCVYILFVRDGKVMGGEAFFPKLPKGSSLSESQWIAESLVEIGHRFVSQYYLTPQRDFPKDIIINTAIEDKERILLEQSISQLADKKVQITASKTAIRGEKARWFELALENAKQKLKQRLSTNTLMVKRYEALQQVLGVSEPIARMECFDVSHSLGEHPVASCVVFDQNGALKSDYRRFNLAIKTGDDYAALEEALTRRYTRLKKEGHPLPTILIIDGGKGQLAVGQKVLKELQIVDVLLMSVAKGEGRKPGLETLYVIQPNESNVPAIIHLPPISAALHLIQAIRDEAHRFAIGAHRKKREKSRRSSPLEGIPNLGPKRRQALLNYFGGLQGLTSASLESIRSVPGIGPELANNIYAYLHGE